MQTISIYIYIMHFVRECDVWCLRFYPCVTNIFVSRGRAKHFYIKVGDKHSMLDVVKQHSCKKTSILVRELGKFSAQAKIFRGPRGSEILVNHIFRMWV